MTQTAKSTYRIHNWPEYNKALIQRGSITLWFSEEAVDKWHETSPIQKKGHPKIYSDDAILCMLMIRVVYNLPLRALQGFLISIVMLLRLNVSVPSYSQVCRRAKTLKKVLKKLSNKLPRDIIFDSTGLKVYGEGEWKVRQHGKSKRRTWRKFHIGLDPNSMEIIVLELTGNGVGCGDGAAAQRMIKKLPKSVKRVAGDGAYDGSGCRKGIAKINAIPLIPPPKGAVIQLHATDISIIQRNDAIAEIQGLGGGDKARKLWKELKGYHIRSLAETMMFRIKLIYATRPC